jgi:site-specific DNA recombinase
LFKSLFRCHGCNRTINWYRQKQQVYGECKNPSCEVRGTVREDTVDAELLPYLSALRAPSKPIVDWVKQELQQDTIDAKQAWTATINALEDALAKIDRKLETLYDDRLDGLISVDDYRRRQVALAAEARSLRDKLARQKRSSPLDSQEHVNFWERSQTVVDRYLKLRHEPDRRRAILREVFASLKLGGRQLMLAYRKEVQLVIETISQHREEFASYEPQKEPSEQGSEGLNDAHRLLWLELVNKLRAIPADELRRPTLDTSPPSNSARKRGIEAETRGLRKQEADQQDAA